MNQSMKREIITRTAESEVTNGSVQGESRLANDIEPPAGPWRWAKLLSFFFWLRVLPCVFRYCREFLCLRYSTLKMQKKNGLFFLFFSSLLLHSADSGPTGADPEIPSTATATSTLWNAYCLRVDRFAGQNGAQYQTRARTNKA